MHIRKLLSREYFPFGTQYYRAPSPRPDDWDGDLGRIASLGLNTVKFWIQWRWNEPRQGHYDFSDIDRLMDLAEKHRLRVMLNTIVDVAPVWIYQVYPDASMLTLDGRRIGPQVQPHRQIGGLGLCFNHAPAAGHMMEFVRASVKRYADHPALEMWNVASEPELTSSMAEMRLYADNAERMGDMLCYCDRCRAAFRQWLETKYGSVAKLNLSWNRNYGAFSDVEVPLTRNSFNDVIDWRMFFVHTLGENVRRRFEAAREEDRGRHPLMCHHVFIQGFPVTSTANDPWNVGKYGDLHAITQMDDPMMCDVVRSCAKGRPVISAEMLMLFGYTLDLPRPVSLNDIKRYVFNGIAANLKGFIFWQYRPETLAREAPAWGLSRLDGSETPLLRGFAEVNSVLQRNASFLLDAAPQEAEVAILYNPENQIFGWAATGNEKNVTDSLLGAHASLYRANFNVDFVHPAEIASGIPARYKVLYVPFPYCLNAPIAAALEEWVRNGGVLIGEAYFAGWNLEEGRHQTTIPGYGLQNVFKARQLSAAPPDDLGQVELIVETDLPLISKGEKVFGAIAKETFALEGAEAVALFADGSPAATYARHGKGSAFLIGSFVALPVHRMQRRTNANLIASLASWKSAITRPTVKGSGSVRVDVLTAPSGEAMVILRNLETSSVRASIGLPGLGATTLTEQFTGRHIALSPSADGPSLTLELAPGEVQVYFG